MMQVRKAAERGHGEHGWLDSWHTFSFADYYDPRHVGFRSLRVMNEDRVLPGAGFGMHPHRDMEILTFVLSGVLEHRDSLGSGAQLRPGEVQHMTAGTGVLHSETNPSAAEPVHLYQVWLLPDRRGLRPGYEQRAFPPAGRHNQFQLVAAPDGRDGALVIHQDARVYLAELDAGREVRYTLEPGRHAWLQVARGTLECNGVTLAAGDGAALSAEGEIVVRAGVPSGVILFDLA
jgi:redox-sensitive bicupin YhaK (pirin superfamily)